MLHRLKNALPLIQAALIVVLALAVLWQITSLARATWEYSTVKSSAVRWEEREKDSEKPGDDDKKEEKKEYAELKGGGLIGLPKPPNPPPQLSAIMGEVAIINNREMKVGDDAGQGMKIIEIQTNKVILEKDGQRTELAVFTGI